MLGLAGCLAAVKPRPQVVLPDQAGHVSALEAPPAGLPVFPVLHPASRAALSAALREVLLLQQLQAAALPDDLGLNDLHAGSDGRHSQLDLSASDRPREGCDRGADPGASLCMGVHQAAKLAGGGQPEADI